MTYLSVCSGIEAATVKGCAKCGQTKALDDFHRHSTGPSGRHSWCKACCTTYYRANKKRNYSAEQRRRWQVRTRYGMSMAEVAALLQSQGGVCAMCAQVPSRPCIDHDHATGAVRGILCHRCNIGLPYVERADFRAQAIAYLERTR